jgi:hypothetical protein
MEIKKLMLNADEFSTRRHDPARPGDPATRRQSSQSALFRSGGMGVMPVSNRQLRRLEAGLKDRRQQVSFPGSSLFAVECQRQFEEELYASDNLKGRDGGLTLSKQNDYRSVA